MGGRKFLYGFFTIVLAGISIYSALPIMVFLTVGQQINVVLFLIGIFCIPCIPKVLEIYIKLVEKGEVDPLENAATQYNEKITKSGPPYESADLQNFFLLLKVFTINQTFLKKDTAQEKLFKKLKGFEKDTKYSAALRKLCLEYKAHLTVILSISKELIELSLAIQYQRDTDILNDTEILNNLNTTKEKLKKLNNPLLANIQKKVFDIYISKLERSLDGVNTDETKYKEVKSVLTDLQNICSSKVNVSNQLVKNILGSFHNCKYYIDLEVYSIISQLEEYCTTTKLEILQKQNEQLPKKIADLKMQLSVEKEKQRSAEPQSQPNNPLVGGRLYQFTGKERPFPSLARKRWEKTNSLEEFTTKE